MGFQVKPLVKVPSGSGSRVHSMPPRGPLFVHETGSFPLSCYENHLMDHEKRRLLRASLKGHLTEHAASASAPPARRAARGSPPRAGGPAHAPPQPHTGDSAPSCPAVRNDPG